MITTDYYNWNGFQMNVAEAWDEYQDMCDDVFGMADALKMSLRGARGRQERIARSREYIHRFEGNDVAAQVRALYLDV